MSQVSESAQNENAKDKEIDLNNKVSFDEAMELTGFGKFNYLVIFMGGMNMVAMLLEFMGISFVLPLAECDMNLTTEDKDYISGVVYAGIIFGSHLWGYMADTKGRQKVMMPTLFIAFGCTVLSSLTNNFWFFAIFRFLNGFFMAGSAATIYVYIGEMHSEKHRTQAIMYACTVLGMFNVLLPGIAYLVLNREWAFYIPLIGIMYKPWNLFLVVSGLPSLVCATMLFMLPESSRFALAQGDQAGAIDICQRINRWNNGGEQAKPLEICGIQEEQEDIENREKLVEIQKSSFPILNSVWMQTAPLFQWAHLRATSLLCLILFTLSASSEGMYMWFPNILNRMTIKMTENPGQHLTLCNAVYSTRPNMTALQPIDEKVCTSTLEPLTYGHSVILEILIGSAYFLVGAIIKYVDKTYILSFLQIMCGIAAVVAALVNIPLLAIYAYVLMILSAVGVNVSSAFAVDLYPTNLRAMAVCILKMAGHVGSAFSSFVVGLLLDYHCTTAFLMHGVMLLVCAALVFLIPRAKHGALA